MAEGAYGRTRLNLSLLASFVAVAVAVAVVPACTVIEPEVGAPLAPCVDADSNTAVDVSFKDQIRPILSGLVPGPRPCADCHYHSTGTHNGINAVQLDLETLLLLKKGGQNTRDNIVVRGSPCKSAIVQKVRGTFGVGARMPKGGPYWSPEQVQLLMDWIAEGVKGGDDE